MGNKDTSPQRSVTAAAEHVECRVLAVNYGRHLKGDVVKVPQREIDRLTRRDREGKVLDRILISLDDEKREIAAQQQPVVERDFADANRRKQAAWVESERVRVAMIDKERRDRAVRVVESAGVEE